MESASLRIKFIPLIKKIASGNPDSKCCIEIVPEVSCFNNLDKINWTLDNSTLEYNIPMTYKIIIKKQEPLHGRKNKIYHSCVDLLQSCSISHSEFASGDVSRIISDNFFLKRITPETEEYDYVLTKDLMNYKELYEKLMGRKTASIQTVNIHEPYSSLSSQRPLVDKALEINIQADTIISNITVSPTEDTHFEAGDMKNNDIQNMYDALGQNEEIIVNNDSSNSIDALIEEFTENNTTRRKLSLSPICSVNTNDMLPTGIVYKKSNTSTYVFKLCHTVSKTNVHSNDHTHCNHYKNQHYDPHGRSSRIFNVHESVTKFVLKNENKIDKPNTENIKPKESHRYPIKDVNTTVFKRLPTVQNSVSHHICNNYRHNTPNNYDRVLAENELTFNNIMNTMNKLHENRYKEYNRILKSRSKIHSEEKMIVSDMFKENRNACKIVCNQEINGGRVLPEVRVANFIQNLEKEIYPLKRMLNEIQYKCAVMGLCCGDIMPKQKSIIYKSISNYNNDSNIKDPRKIRRSNRVVYTVLFNG